MSKGRWVRKWRRDAGTDGFSPLPTQVVSNEEYIPLAQTRSKKRVAALIDGDARRTRAGSGVEPARLPLLQRGDGRGLPGVEHGLRTILRGRSRRGDRVGGGRRAEAVGPVHLRRPDPSRRRPPEVSACSSACAASGAPGTPDLAKDRGTMEDLYLGNYIKEIFRRQRHDGRRHQRDSVADDGTRTCRPTRWSATRDVINELAGSQRLSRTGSAAQPGAGDLDEMGRQVKELKIGAWKMYTGCRIGERSRGAWTTRRSPTRSGDDAAARHQEPLRPQGAAAPGGVEEYWHPRDLESAARTFPTSTSSSTTRRSTRSDRPGGRARRVPHIVARGLGHRPLRHPAAQSRPHEHLCRAGRHVRTDGDHLSAGLRPRARHARPGVRRRSRAVGHRLHLVGLAPVADRGLAHASRCPSRS